MTDVRVDGAWKAIAYGEIRVGDSWKRLNRVETYVGGAWKAGDIYAPPLSATISDATPFGYTSGGAPAFTSTVTVTPVGGIAPYTYSWARSSGVGSAVNPTSATTAFTATPGYGVEATGDFVCTVTDSLGSTAIAPTVSATFEDFGGF